MDKRCRQVIRDHQAWCESVAGNSFPPSCIFGDLEHCLPEGTYHPKATFMQKLEQISKSPLMAKQWCYSHQTHCCLFGQAATDFEISGLPCWDYSLAGTRRAEDGPTNTVFMTHAKMHKERRTPLMVLENVQASPNHMFFFQLFFFAGPIKTQSNDCLLTCFGCNEAVTMFDVEFTAKNDRLQKSSGKKSQVCGLLSLSHKQALKLRVVEYLYGDDYELYPIFLDVGDQGHTGASRPRVYIICAHKERVVPLHNVYDLYAAITAKIRKHVHTSPSDYLVSDHWEIMRDAAAHAQTRGMHFQPATWRNFNRADSVYLFLRSFERTCEKSETSNNCHDLW